MKKKLLLLILFIPMAVGLCFSQINADFLKKEKPMALVNYAKELPDFSSASYNVQLQSLTFSPRNNVVSMDNMTNPSRDAWIGQSQQTTFDFYNIPVKTNYQFDIKGQLRSSSMSIKLNK